MFRRVVGGGEGRTTREVYVDGPPCAHYLSFLSRRRRRRCLIGPRGSFTVGFRCKTIAKTSANDDDLADRKREPPKACRETKSFSEQ